MVKLHKDGEGNREALGMSSNINEVIKTVLNFSLFFYEKILHALNAPKSTKSIKSTKTQPSKSTKTQISKQKQLMYLKTSKGKKVTYLLICVFVLAKKKVSIIEILISLN